MARIDKYFESFIVPEDADKTMRIHEIERDGETRRYALMTSEAKAFLQGSTSHKYRRVSFEDWARLAFVNYAAQRSVFQKLPFELELTIFHAKDPRGNGYVGTQAYSLITANGEQAIMKRIIGGAMVSMERKTVDINEWLKYVMFSYYDEEHVSVDPRYDEDMAISLEEVEEYNDLLTMDEKLGNY